ncbi:Uncharacterised protein [Escherichia coli]|uniref:Uncharacterized protein n=1 Tax=Escherichia coli TaxID=562 RepID=A0A2X1MV58_ECOLX|nr:Uncharacterised protein [Escherichia coli]
MIAASISGAMVRDACELSGSAHDANIWQADHNLTVENGQDAAGPGRERPDG